MNTTSLSIFNKQQLAKDSNSILKWEVLDSKDKKLIQAVCFSDSIEDARKNLKLSIHGFYARWQYLKPLFNSLIDNLPQEALNLLKVSSKTAAKTLVDNLQALNPADQIKAANSVLDRTVGRNSEDSKVIRRMTVEEFESETFIT